MRREFSKNYAACQWIELLDTFSNQARCATKTTDMIPDRGCCPVKGKSVPEITVETFHGRFAGWNCRP